MKIIDVRVMLLKSNPPHLFIDATGTVNSTGWTNPKLQIRLYAGGSSPDGFQDFDFVADSPSGITNFVITPIRTTLTIEGGLPSNCKGIRVHSATNNIEKTFASGDLTTYQI